MLAQEELYWYQKSRVAWIKDGDRNTKFFHLSTIVRQWRNKIVEIKGDDGEWIHDKELVKNQIVTYFSNLFTEEGEGEIFNIPSDVFPELAQHDWDSLNVPFTKCDIDMVVKRMGSLKAPGPDGFQALFFQKTGSL